MEGVGSRHLLGYDTSKTYSPIVLNQEWSSLGRLILLFFLGIFGSIINGFFVSSFLIEATLRKPGNVYLACVGVADLLITTAVIPTAIAVLISSVWDVKEVCYTLQFLTQASTYIYSLSFAMVAIENYVRLYRARRCYEKFISISVSVVSITIFAICFATSGVGVIYGLDYDYCTRDTYGDYVFRFATSLIFYGFPFLFTILFLVFSSMVVRARARHVIRYKRSKQYARDYAFVNLNLGCYALYVLAWVPYLIIVNKYPYTSDSNYYNCVWLGLSRSIITSILYGCFNKNIGHVYSHLFYYLCCKSSIGAPLSSRHRWGEGKTGDICMHIMSRSVKKTQRKQKKVSSNSRNACKI